MEDQIFSDHPWGKFLDARIKVILWMKNEQGRDDFEIAYSLSMNQEQVRLIREYAEQEEIREKKEMKND